MRIRCLLPRSLLSGLTAFSPAAQVPRFVGSGDRPARRQCLLCRDGGGRRRRRQARRRGRDRGRRRLVPEPVLEAPRHHPGTDREGQRLHPAARHRRRRPVDFALGAGWRPPDTATASTLQWLGRDSSGSLADPSDRLPGAHAPPAALGRRQGHGQEAARRRPASGPRHQGAELGRGAGGARARLRRPRRPVRTVLARRSRRRLAAHDPQPPTRRPRRRRSRRDRARLLGRGLSARPVSATASGRRTQLGSGNQDRPRRPRGPARSRWAGSPSGSPFIATIEPWHGFQVVVYTPVQRTTDSGTARSSPSRCSGATPSGAPTSTATRTTS